jgi:hypothetical protein
VALKKHVDVYHVIIIKKIVEKVNGPIKGTFEKKPMDKRPNVLGNAISKFFIVEDIFKKDDEYQKYFLQDLGLLIVKINCHYNLWKCLVQTCVFTFVS